MRRLMIALVVLAALAVVGDRVAEHVAEGQVATLVEEREGLSESPNVEFVGFPFVTQVLGNDLQEVRMSLPAVDADAGAEEIRVDNVEATFFDVRTTNGFKRATADRMTGSALISYDSVSDLGPYTASYAGTNDKGVGFITLVPDDGVLAVDMDLSVDLGVEVKDGSLSFIGADGTSRVVPVPGNLKPLLGTLLDVSHPLHGLPSSFTVESLDVREAGIALVLSGSDIPLGR